MTLPRLLLALVCTVLAVRTAAADDAATRTARLHFERGEKLYALTRFSEAIDEYQQAFDARPIPDFLFNIGQCYRNLGDYDAAIFSFRKYLTLAPDAPNRAQVEDLIGQLQAQKEQGDTRRLGLSRPPERPAAPPPPPGRPFYKAWWFWTGVAVVGAVGGVTIYEVTRPHGPPSTNLGNIVFGR
ncbi:MAG: tetratricopeptide repeat protein [Deltaproteobacteria bacterium]|nr:MAG: tetratricopeptide repeat protein [Deltaproteobacteria bacterium]